MENVIIECRCGHEYPARVDNYHHEEADGGLTLCEHGDRSCPECDYMYDHEEPVIVALRRIKIPKADPQG